jgi:hypothetical protein
LVWLGPATNDNDLAIARIRDIGEEIFSKDDTLNAIEEFSALTPKSLDYPASARVFNRSLNDNGGSVEFTLAKEVDFLCGYNRVDETTMLSVLFAISQGIAKAWDQTIVRTLDFEAFENE